MMAAVTRDPSPAALRDSVEVLRLFGPKGAGVMGVMIALLKTPKGCMAAKALHYIGRGSMKAAAALIQRLISEDGEGCLASGLRGIGPVATGPLLEAAKATTDRVILRRIIMSLSRQEIPSEHREGVVALLLMGLSSDDEDLRSVSTSQLRELHWHLHPPEQWLGILPHLICALPN